MSTKALVHHKPRPAAEMEPFETLDWALDDLFDFPLLRGRSMNEPDVDIKETEKEIEVSVSLPGVEKKDIHLDLTENSLAVSCERREEKDEKGAGGYRLREQSYGRFYRSFTLPASVRTGDAKAVYKNGVLDITLQKQKTGKTHEVTIQ